MKWAVPIVPMLVLLVEGLRSLTTRGMWQNEYVAWLAFTMSWDNLFKLMDRVDGVKFLYFTAMHLWVDVAGDSAFALRVPSLAFMLVAVGAAALIGTKLFNHFAGLAAGLMMALSPSTIRYGQEIQAYAGLVALVCVATLLALYAMPRRNFFLWFAYALVMVLAGWTHILALLIIPAHGVLFGQARRAGKAQMFVWPSLVFAISLACLPVVLVGASQSESIEWIKLDVAGFPVGLFMSSFVAFLVLATASLTVIASFSSKSARGTVVFLLVWALLPALIGLITFHWTHAFLPRYFLFSLPALTILAAGLLTMPTLKSPSFVRAVVAAAVVLVLIGGFTGRELVRDAPVDGRHDFRAAVDILVKNQQDGDAIAFGGRNMSWIREAVDYELHGRKKPKDIFMTESARNIGKYVSRECKDFWVCARGVDRIWLITTATAPDPTTELDRQKASVLRTNYRITKTYNTQMVRLVLLQRK
jgi:mannosyltransferase